MLNKRIFFILFMSVTALGLVSSVGASDLGTNATLDEIGIQDNLNTDNFETYELNAADSNEDILTNDDGTFTALQAKIDNAAEGSTIELENDYIYNANFGNTNGIEITKSLTINGNGHVIDGASKSDILYIHDAENIVLSNITFQNSHNGVYLYDVNTYSIVNCNFTGNKNVNGNGGAIFSWNTYSSSIVNCSFLGNSAGSYIPGMSGEDSYTNVAFRYGGAIMLVSVECSLIDSCTFDGNTAYGTGGAVQFHKVKDSQVTNSNFYNSVAYYGGTIQCEDSALTFKNSNIANSLSLFLGGSIDLMDSNFTAEGCIFLGSTSLRDAGGIIYNSKGNARILNSSFVLGESLYGGAIANSKGNLTVFSSEFINNSAANGGSIYTNHGNVYVNGSFFNNSHSIAGSAVYGMLSNSLTFTNNIFLNSTGGQFIIYSDYSNRPVVESGNHFENIIRIRAVYVGHINGEEFTVKSRVLNYVVSNTGKYLNTYDFEDEGDDSEFVSMNLYDLNHPENSTVYGSFDSQFKAYFDFTKISNLLEGEEYLYFESYDASNNQIDKIETVADYMNVTLNFTMKGRILFENDDFLYYEGRTIRAIPLINTTYSSSTALPSYYNSKDYGYVTPVKNQGDGGNCWAFSGIATLEACIKKITGVTYDFSENNPKNLMAMDSVTGWNIETNKHGYDLMIIGYLNSWLGPVDEKYDLYNIYSSESLVLKSDFYVQNVYFLPPRQTSSDNDLYKRAIMDYGAISVSLDWNGDGHAVSVVGWDDNYNNYDSLGTWTRGAWIFKNSWGTGWGNDGYGYLSYSTPFYSDDYSGSYAYTFVFNKNDDYIKNYQYDYSGATDYIINDEGSIFYENRFVCSENSDYDQELAAFATYFTCPTDYTVSVYLNGKLALTQDGHSEAGYYTIPFNEKIDVNNGDEFAIRVESRNNGINYVPVCMADETTITNVKPGISFISYDGNRWFDLYDFNRYATYEYSGTRTNTCQAACIKAFTYCNSAYVVELKSSEFEILDVNEKVTLFMTLTGDHYYFDTNQATEGTLITVNVNGKDYYAQIHNERAYLELSFDKGGSYSLSAQYKNNYFMSNNVEFSFTVNKDNTVLVADAMSKIYGGSESSIVTLKDINGNLIKDEIVTFTINGVSFNLRTNSNGQIRAPIDVVPNTYIATISYAGNDRYYGTSTKIVVLVAKAVPKLVAANKKFKLKVKKKKYSVTLKDNLGRAVKNAQITIKIKKKTYKAFTDANGKATFKLKLTKKGKYKATVRFAGNAYYNPVAKNVKINVKK